jgi:8-oxo-dGTP pyrophosphatase MutT (NUDIX family)
LDSGVVARARIAVPGEEFHHPSSSERITMSLPVRRVSRVILLDRGQNVLLVRYQDPAPMDPEGMGPTTYWVPPGGALDRGEDHARAALREMQEETGLVVELGPRILEIENRLRVGGRLVTQKEIFYLAKLDKVRPPVSNSSPEAIVDQRWWSLDELKESGETLFPDEFIRLMTEVIQRSDAPA